MLLCGFDLHQFKIKLIFPYLGQKAVSNILTTNRIICFHEARCGEHLIEHNITRKKLLRWFVTVDYLLGMP